MCGARGTVSGCEGRREKGARGREEADEAEWRRGGGEKREEEGGREKRGGEKGVKECSRWGEKIKGETSVEVKGFLFARGVRARF